VRHGSIRSRRGGGRARLNYREKGLYLVTA
jgi:hypothetical protein